MDSELNALADPTLNQARVYQPLTHDNWDVDQWTFVVRR
jgi:hypothetical protein